MFKQILIMCVVMLMTSIFTVALDDEGNPNNPTVNDRANACYEDGSMANKCDTDWEWKCGWHLIQFEYNLTTRDEFPSWCISIIPPETLPEELETEAPTQTGFCVNFDHILWILAPASQYMPIGSYTNLYSDDTCSSYENQFYAVAPMVYANNITEATALCAAHGHILHSQVLPELYQCYP